MRKITLFLSLTLVVGLALGAFLMWAFQPLPGHPWRKTFIEHMPDWFVAGFTAALTLSTLLLWRATAELAAEARDNSKKLLKMETPYLSGGGDFVRKDHGGVELFRLDIENHGKTAAFITGYDLQFAKLAELQEEERKGQEPRPVNQTHRHIEGISPRGARKNVFTQTPMKEDADVVFGAVYYDDPILGEEHHTRFILRIAPTRDIPGHGLTRLDVAGVNRGYWSWDYDPKKQADASGSVV